jgi:two-component system response regulator AtoC
LAEGGTLLLNEIGELSLALQAKLLTFLDTRKFSRVGGEKEVSANARLIAATNRDLEAEVKAGRFRQDLFYRLNVLPITIPPLRERREDIPILLNQMLGKLRKELPVPADFSLDPAFVESAMNYDWPGNVRELRNAVERAMVTVGHQKVVMKGSSAQVADSETKEWEFKVPFIPEKSVNTVSADLKRAFILEALRRSSGKRQEAARLLGISRYSLKHYKKSLDIPDEE